MSDFEISFLIQSHIYSTLSNTEWGWISGACSRATRSGGKNQVWGGVVVQLRGLSTHGNQRWVFVLHRVGLDIYSKESSTPRDCVTNLKVFSALINPGVIEPAPYPKNKTGRSTSYLLDWMDTCLSSKWHYSCLSQHIVTKYKEDHLLITFVL